MSLLRICDVPKMAKIQIDRKNPEIENIFARLIRCDIIKTVSAEHPSNKDKNKVTKKPHGMVTF